MIKNVSSRKVCLWIVLIGFRQTLFTQAYKYLRNVSVLDNNLKGRWWPPGEYNQAYISLWSSVPYMWLKLVWHSLRLSEIINSISLENKYNWWVRVNRIRCCNYGIIALCSDNFLSYQIFRIHFNCTVHACRVICKNNLGAQCLSHH